MKPITLAIGLLSTANSFTYASIDSYSGILSNSEDVRIKDYINSVDYNDSFLYLNKIKFQDHLKKWETNTMFLSSTKAIIEDKDFQAIVSMGYSAVQFIIEEIENNPSTLVWALNLIFNKKITNNPNATISEACKLWVQHLKK
jgi:hypothetical protein